MMLVLDDHPIARQGLQSIIQIYKPDEKVFQASNVREAIEYAEKLPMNMVFIDINLGKESGFDFLKWIDDNNLNTKTFMITSSSNENDFLYAKSMGVDAYILKDAFIDDIMYGLKVVERGGKFYSATLIENMGTISDDEKLINSLTKREIEVLHLLSKGYSNAKISNELYLSEGTVKKHISNILSKLDLENRVEVVLFANKNNDKIALHMENEV